MDQEEKPSNLSDIIFSREQQEYPPFWQKGLPVIWIILTATL